MKIPTLDIMAVIRPFLPIPKQKDYPMSIDHDTWAFELSREYSDTTPAWTLLEGAIRLVLFAHPDKDVQGYTSISHTDLAARAGSTRRSTARSLETLIKQGTLSMIEGSPNKYRVIFFDEWAEWEEKRIESRAA